MSTHICPTSPTYGIHRGKPSLVLWIWGSCAIVVFSGSCASWQAANADHEVHTLLASYKHRTLGDRTEWVRLPTDIPEPVTPASTPPDIEDGTPAPAADDTLSTMAAPDSNPPPLLLDLPTSLRLAFSTSRDYLDQKEALYLAGLQFTLTRHDFGPILNSTISYLWNDAENSRGNDSLTASLGVSQILPTGGGLSVSGDATGSRSNDPALFRHPDPAEYSYSSTVALNLSQPLLRGFGYEISHEALTQGERNLIYALRAFELFRQDFCIRVTSAYYSLVSQKMQLANDEQNYQNAVLDYKKTMALKQVARARPDDVFLARRREIEAEDALLVARTDYKLAQDDVKLLLGLPTSTEIEIPDDEPVFKKVRTDPDSAVEVALHNRLDLHTLHDRVADAERQVRRANNGLLPDLDLTADWSFDNDARKPYDPTPERWSASVGLVLDVPLDRKAERNAYRSSLITLKQIRRTLERRQDEVERDIFDQLRQLAQLEKRIDLQKDQIDFEQRAVTVTKIRYESGDAEARDLLDARQGLINAQNALISLKVQHFLARLGLMRNLGVLFIDQEGLWQE